MQCKVQGRGRGGGEAGEREGAGILLSQYQENQKMIVAGNRGYVCTYRLAKDVSVLV